MHLNTSRRAGFTLVEIMIVVAIIGLLAAVAIPNLSQGPQVGPKDGLHGNLKSIEGVKATWALNNRKGDTDVPTEADLCGPDKDLSRKPECPGNGTYNFGSIAEKPTCTVPDHVLP